MEAFIDRGLGGVALETVTEPKVQQLTHPNNRTSAIAIRESDLQFMRALFPGLTEGRFLDHDAVRFAEETGKTVGRPEIWKLSIGLDLFIGD